MAKPPVGIVIIGFIALMAGISHLFAGFTLSGVVVFGNAELGSGLFLWGALTIVIGIVLIACAFALWSTAPWAWLLTNLVAVLGVIDAIFVLFASGSVAYGLGVALLPAIVLWYLNQDHVKAAFEIEGTTD